MDRRNGFNLGLTRVLVASWEQHVLVSAMLVWMGADPEIKNFYKLSPKDEARGDVCVKEEEKTHFIDDIYLSYFRVRRIGRNRQKIPSGFITEGVLV